MITTPTTKGVITDAAHFIARVLRTHGPVSRTGRNVTMPHDGDVVVRSPRDNRPVLIGGIIFPSTMGNGGSQDIIRKHQSTSPSVSRNAQTFYASVGINLTNDRDYAGIFSKVMGRELSKSISANIYLHCWV